MSEETFKGFGINNETKTENNVKMLPPQKLEKATAEFPSGYSFPVGFLVNVVATKITTKNEEEKNVLQFVFVDQKKRQYIHTEWEIKSDDVKYSTKIESLNSRYAHLYTRIIGSLEGKAIGADAKSFGDYFAKLAEPFTAAKETISKKPFYLKLIYDNNDNLGFPYAPNFIQLKDNTACMLEINTKYDTIVQSQAAQGIPGIAGATPAGDVPSFENGFS